MSKELTVDARDYIDLKMIDGDVKRFKETVCPYCQLPTRGLVVIRDTTGWLVYCHRCNTGRKFYHDGISFSTVKKMLKQNLDRSNLRDSTQVKKVTLPSDFTTDIPESGMKWLRTYHVTDEEIRKYRFGFSPSYDRLIIPVFGDEGVKYWQGRRLNSDLSQPKYVNFTQSRTEVFFVVDNKHDTTVVVEDVLSALAIGRAGYNSLALLGSNINSNVCGHLPKGTRKVKVWLDPDMRKKCVSLAKKIRSQGYLSSPILLTNKDPKEYLPEMVKTIIEEGKV